MAYRPHITDAQQVFSDEEIIALMPKSFAFVAKLIGVAAALHFIDTYGGTSIFIPNKHALNIDHEITHIIGLKQLQLLADNLGNAYVEVPMGTPITVAMRNKSIRDLAEKRVSQSKLARKFGVTQRTIRNVVNGEEKPKIINEDQNYDLFND